MRLVLECGVGKFFPTPWSHRFRGSIGTESHDRPGRWLYNSANIDQLKRVYATLQAQFGYDTIRGDASTSWFRLAALVLAIASLAALLINRRIPT